MIDLTTFIETKQPYDKPLLALSNGSSKIAVNFDKNLKTSAKTSIERL